MPSWYVVLDSGDVDAESLATYLRVGDALQIDAVNHRDQATGDWHSADSYHYDWR